MANLIEQLSLMNVETTEQSVTFDFLDESEGMLYPVKWNIQAYDETAKKWVDSDEQKEKVEEWAKEYFNTNLEGLNNLGEDVKKDVWHNGKFNSLWEVKYLSKFDKERKGEILNVTIKDVYRDDFGLKVKYENGGEDYACNFSTSKYFRNLKKSFTDASKEMKAKEKFEEIFGVPFEDGEKLIGEEMMVEIKAIGVNTYAEPKKFNGTKKKAIQSK